MADPVYTKENCPLCKYDELEYGTTLYQSNAWDGGVCYDSIWPVRFCPFCGSDRVYYTETDEQHYPDHVEGFIWCRGCGFSSDVFIDPEIAAEKWNRRANDV